MKRKTRPPVKQDAIIEFLRESILEGSLKSGDRFPTRSEIEQRFEASSATVQRAFDRLVEDGFVSVRGKDGTYVAENLPHLSRYGIAFPKTFALEGWSQFYTAMMAAAHMIEGEGTSRLPCYMGVDGGSHGEGYRTLVRDVCAHRVAGIIFPGRPCFEEHYPLRPRPGLPWALLMSSPPLLPEAIAVDLGGVAGFLDRALEYLASRGRRRIALIAVAGFEAERLEHFGNRLPAFGMTTNPYWHQAVDPAIPKWADNVAHLMFHEGHRERPDGLIVTDDNLVEHASAGLIQARVSVPGDVEVVAHCNFPTPTPSVLPVVRLGYDIREALRTCMTLIDRQNRRETVSEYTVIPPVFEWEVPSPGPPMFRAKGRPGFV